MKKVLIKKIKVDSQVIKSIMYNYVLEILTVKFHTGQKYDYFKVPNDTFISLKNSDSIGKFFNKEIKSNFN